MVKIVYNMKMAVCVVELCAACHDIESKLVVWTV